MDDPDDLEAGTAGELEAGGGGERRAPVADGFEVSSMSIAEAAERYGVSDATVRRAIRAGRLPGVWKVPTPKGDQWRVTDAAMFAAGYTVPVPAAEASAVQLAAVEARAADLEAELANARNRIVRLEAERDYKAREVELLTASVDDLRAALRKLPDALPAPAPPVKRSRWRRSGPAQTAAP